MGNYSKKMKIDNDLVAFAQEYASELARRVENVSYVKAAFTRFKEALTSLVITDQSVFGEKFGIITDETALDIITHCVLILPALVSKAVVDNNPITKLVARFLAEVKTPPWEIELKKRLETEKPETVYNDFMEAMGWKSLIV